MPEITTITGSSGNQLIDGLLATTESLNVPVADRANVAGTTAAKWGGPIGEGVTLTYSFATAGSTFVGGYGAAANDVRELTDAAKAAIRSALGEWSAFANVQFQEVGESSTSWGDLRLFVSGSNPNQSADSEGAEAYTPSSPGTFGPERAGDIIFTPAAMTQWGFSVGQDGYRTVLHELGHAVFNLTDVSTSAGFGGAVVPGGLNDQTQTLMSYSVTPGATAGDDWTQTAGSLSAYPTGPMVLDVLAAQYLYGANATHNAGDDLYLFSADGTYVETIWDAGGTDTIQYVAADDGAVIDLRGGAYSELGQGIVASPPSGATTIPATVGIAHGAVIENAIGDGGDDILVGNDTGNGLTGNVGADTLTGNAGNDLMFGNSGSDLLFGNTNDDTLFGGQDDDTLYAGQDADIVCGNLGDDLLFGNLGDDALYGGQGSDTLFGGQGDDQLFGNLGDDVLYGNLGADTFFRSSGNDQIADFNAAEGDRISGDGLAFAAIRDADGSAVIEFGVGSSLTLIGVAPSAALSALFV